ncbi:MAG: short-chain fatty acyl-CoA regulator family protein, partial [Rhodospirillaceae bacterium]|nr:short-chain fatty acyl-CoA regulator family protein [Rhodospirillaceae bacterium]
MANEAGRKIFAGPRLRRLRRDLGLTQVQMAEGLGISPSYLNLIERNQRPVSAQLLLNLAETYDVNLKTLVGDEEGRTLSDLREVMSDPLLQHLDTSAQDLKDVHADNPALAQALITLYRAYRQTLEQAASLSERLEDVSAITPAASVPFPVEEVRDFFVAHKNHFPELEQAAEQLRNDLAAPEESLSAALVRHLKARHGITVRVMPLDHMTNLIRRFDRHSLRLFLLETLPAPARDFQMAFQIGLLEHATLIEALIDKAGIGKGETRRLVRISLTSYFAGAVLLPYDPFLAAAEKTRYDIELLAERFGASYEQVCHRLTTLQKPGAQGVPFFFIRLDHAGNISKRLSAGGFHFARFGGACPRWNVHDAFRSPGKIATQIVQMPQGTTYFSISRTVDGVYTGHHGQQTQFAIGLGCEISHAARLVYADGYKLDDPRLVVPIGLNCRLCERTGCSHRAFPPLSRNLILDENMKSISPFVFHSRD